MMNKKFRKPLPGTKLDYFDTRAAIESIAVDAYDRLPYTSRVLAENLLSVRHGGVVLVRDEASSGI